MANYLNKEQRTKPTCSTILSVSLVQQAKNQAQIQVQQQQEGVEMVHQMFQKIPVSPNRFVTSEYTEETITYSVNEFCKDLKVEKAFNDYGKKTRNALSSFQNKITVWVNQSKSARKLIDNKIEWNWLKCECLIQNGCIVANNGNVVVYITQQDLQYQWYALILMGIVYVISSIINPAVAVSLVLYIAASAPSKKKD
eukprot:58730_1